MNTVMVTMKRLGLGKACCSACAESKPCAGTKGVGQPQAVTVSWAELPQGEDVAVRQGYAYAAIASIKKTRSKDDIVSFLQGKGLTVSDYAEQGDRAAIPTDPDPDYKTVTLITDVAQADGGTIPWQVPALLPGRDHAIRVWAGPVDPTKPARPAPPTASAWPWVVGVLALGGAAGAIAVGVHVYKTRHP